MAKEKTTESLIGGYFSTLLRTNFGKGPTSVFVAINGPYLAIHLRGFIGPMEKILLKQNEMKRIMEIRDLLLNELRSDIILELWKIANLEIQEIYADWDLQNETGLIIGVIIADDGKKEMPWPKEVDHKAFEGEINKASAKAEKTPEQTKLVWLNDRMILVERSGILIQLEKELIGIGVIEELKMAKRPLERKMLDISSIEAIVERKVIETFVDWNFEKDLGYMVFILEAPSKTGK